MTEYVPEPPEKEEDEPKVVYPFKTVNVGEDSIGIDDDIVFADFRPTVLPSDSPDEQMEEVDLAPKASSVREPADSTESPPSAESASDQTASQQDTTKPGTPPAAGKEDGMASPQESS